MKPVSVCVLVLALGCAASVSDPSAPDDEKKGASDKAQPALPEVPAALADTFKEQAKLHKRQTGALLTITAKWAKHPVVEPAVSIEWAIDYNGPRKPFAILAPNLDDRARGQTTAHFWYLDNDGKKSGFKITAPVVAGKAPTKQKTWFEVAAGDKPVTGEIVKGGSYLRGYFGQVPETGKLREPEPGNPSLWVQLHHAPTDRGDGYEQIVDPGPLRQVSQGPPWTLDAWTGSLWSPVVPVTIE